MLLIKRSWVIAKRVCLAMRRLEAHLLLQHGQLVHQLMLSLLKLGDYLFLRTARVNLESGHTRVSKESASIRGSSCHL